MRYEILILERVLDQNTLRNPSFLMKFQIGEISSNNERFVDIIT